MPCRAGGPSQPPRASMWHAKSFIIWHVEGPRLEAVLKGDWTPAFLPYDLTFWSGIKGPVPFSDSLVPLKQVHASRIVRPRPQPARRAGPRLGDAGLARLQYRQPGRRRHRGPAAVAHDV